MRFDLDEAFGILLLSGVFIWMITYLVGIFYKPAAGIKFGMFFLIMILAVAIYGAFMVVRQKFEVSRSAMLLFVIVFVVLTILALKIPTMFPKQFDATTIQSALSFMKG